MNFLRDLLNVFYPEICVCCSNYLATNEQLVCIRCRHDLPLTNFSFEKNNAVEQTFYGRIPVERATALFYFSKKGSVQQLIHSLKYKNQQQIGTFLGDWMGTILIECGNYDTIDCIIPVPLHKKKLKSRGYNQVTSFGKSLAQQLNIPYIDDVLLRVSATKTQTKKLRFDRWRNVQQLFYAEHYNTLENKHVLLIDDIVTTGATLEACYKAFEKTKNLKISIACMAYTK